MFEVEKALWPRQIIGATAIGILFVFSGELFNPFSSSGASYESVGGILLYFWVLPVPLFSIAGIWFGAWGVIAVPIASSLIYPYSLSDWPFQRFLLGVVLDVLIPTLAFRFLKIDLRLNKKRTILRTILVFLVFGVITTSLTASWLQWWVYHIFHVFVWNRGIDLTTWIINSIIMKAIIGFPLLLLGSRIVLKARAHCKGWLS